MTQNGAASTTSGTPPVIQVTGDNPAIIRVGDTYADLGATIAGPQADLNLGIKMFLNGTLVSTIVLNTSSVATDTIDLTVTSTRTILSSGLLNRSHEPAPPSRAPPHPLTLQNP